MSWADKFNLLNGIVILRLICGAVLHPAYRRQVHRAGDPGLLRRRQVQSAGDLDVHRRHHRDLAGIGLIFDIYTPYVAAIAAFHLFVAGAATYKVTKKWIWVIGGIEYCVFWMLACVALAMLTWPK